MNPEAYEDYLRGRYYLENQFTLAGPLKMAKTYFEKSAQKDPQFASAYSGLALAYTFLAFYGNGQLSPDQAYRLAKEASQKALELNEGNGEAHYALALLSSQFEWDFKAAEREFDDSIALTPAIVVRMSAARSFSPCLAAALRRWRNWLKLVSWIPAPAR